MNDYKDFPPLAIFKKVLQNHPNVALLYAAIWRAKSDTLDLKCRRRDINRRFLVSPTVFKNQLTSLARMELLTFQETKEFFLIDFATQNG